MMSVEKAGPNEVGAGGAGASKPLEVPSPHNRSPLTTPEYLAVAGVFLAALALRTVNLGRLPLGFFCDEASTGYDAWCLLKTGRDQYGALLPLFVRSLGDYNEALYRYLAVPSVALLGLNEFATRLPAAVIGALTILPLYGFTRRAFDGKTALAAAALLAVSPWHLHLSRVAFRAILLPFFICLGLYFFERGLRRSRFLWPAALALALSLYSYSSARVFTPLLVAALGVLFWSQLKERRRTALGALTLLIVLAVPAAFFWFSPEGLARARLSMAPSALRASLNYISYFDPFFLFNSGDPNLRHSAPGVGQLLMFEALTVPVGLWALFRSRDPRRLLILALVALYPLPAALTASHHALRAIIGAPIFAIVSAVGAVTLVRQFASRRMRWPPAIGAILALGSLGLFMRAYFVQYRSIEAPNWQRGMGEAIVFADAQGIAPVYVSDKFFIPHVFVLFYTAYPPEAYQAHPLLTIEQGKWEYTDFQMGKFRIQDVENADPPEGLSLYVVEPKEAYDVSSRSSEAKVLFAVNDDYDAALIQVIAARGKTDREWNSTPGVEPAGELRNRGTDP